MNYEYDIGILIPMVSCSGFWLYFFANVLMVCCRYSENPKNQKVELLKVTPRILHPGQSVSDWYVHKCAVIALKEVAFSEYVFYQEVKDQNFKNTILS